MGIGTREWEERMREQDRDQQGNKVSTFLKAFFGLYQVVYIMFSLNNDINLCLYKNYSTNLLGYYYTVGWMF